MTEPHTNTNPNRLQLWVGPEASHTRVGERRVDQLDSTGFADRLDDLDLLAELGATAIRMPVLWERSERGPGEWDFGWADTRMARLRELGLRPIVGLLHHGSGPSHTDLLDPGFPAKLADYARAVARRYPWVEDWTPVNEPLTTARFSALYGLWYPHRRNDADFVRALLHQVQATRLAMQAVREVIPAARLVQTEDLGHTDGTAPLQEQVRFDNERRWLSLDLLTGRVDRDHALYRYLRQAGASADELAQLWKSPCAPQVVGINCYVTSERFLDHRLERYPAHSHGGNGRQVYADVEAVRVSGAEFGGFGARLREAHARYGLPLALTEVQLGCSREEQLRWFWEAWQAAAACREEGVDVRAVTAWATFGAHDWNSLLTRPTGDYEPGLFDIRGPGPRPTALAALVRELATRSAPPSHPVLVAPGWWRRIERHVYEPHGQVRSLSVQGAPVLILGGRGTLAQAFARLCRVRGLPYRLLAREDVDIADPLAVQRALQRWSPWAVVNAAGFVRVDDAEHDAAQWRANAIGPAVLARACERAGVQLLTFSSDLVFDGAQSRPYVESDTPRPLNAYGRAKLHAEQRVVELPHVLLVRTSAFFGPWDAHNFLARGLERLAAGEPWLALDDQTVSPTYVPDLVHASLDLLVDREQGLWHLANQGSTTWYDFACRAAEAGGWPRRLVQPLSTAAAGLTARRPAYSVLGSELGMLTPHLDVALERFVREAESGRREAGPDWQFA